MLSKWLHTGERYAKFLLTAGMLWIAGHVAFWYADSKYELFPVLGVNQTFTDKSFYLQGERIIVNRNAEKLRNCTAVKIEHRLIDQNDKDVFLPPVVTARTVIRNVGDAPEFKITYIVPVYVPEGVYKHRVLLKYRCNPFFETKTYVSDSSNIIKIGKKKDT